MKIFIGIVCCIILSSALLSAYKNINDLLVLTEFGLVALCLVLINLDKISAFSLSAKGFELKTLIKEAEETLSLVHKLAETNALTTLIFLGRGVLNDSYNTKEAEFIKNSVLENLAKLGCNKDSANRIKEIGWDKYIDFSYVLEILDKPITSKNLNSDFYALQQSLKERIDSPVGPNELEDFLKR